jgi:hypothetical protein
MAATPLVTRNHALNQARAMSNFGLRSARCAHRRLPRRRSSAVTASRGNVSLLAFGGAVRAPAPNGCEQERTKQPLPRRVAERSRHTGIAATTDQEALPLMPVRCLFGKRRSPFAGLFYGRYWARTSDPQLVDLRPTADAGSGYAEGVKGLIVAALWVDRSTPDVRAGVARTTAPIMRLGETGPRGSGCSHFAATPPERLLRRRRKRRIAGLLG